MAPLTDELRVDLPRALALCTRVLGLSREEVHEIVRMFPALVQEVRQTREATLVYSPGQAESPGVPPTRYVPAGAPTAPLTAEEIAELRRFSDDERSSAAGLIDRALDEVEESRARYGDHLDVMEIAHKDGTAARAWIGRARELLKRIEFEGTGRPRNGKGACPECGGIFDCQHEPDCELAALIDGRAGPDLRGALRNQEARLLAALSRVETFGTATEGIIRTALAEVRAALGPER